MSAMTTKSVTVTSQQPTPRARNFRRCGRCRCPGHVSTKCRVYSPEYHAWEEPWVAPSMNRSARQSEHDRLGRLGLTARAMTKESYMRDWIDRRGTTGLTSREIQKYQDCAPLSIQEYDQAEEAKDQATEERWRNGPNTPRPAPRPVQPVYTLNDTAGQNAEFWAALFRNDPNAFSGSSHTPAPVEEPELKVVEKPIEETTCPICLDTLGETNRSVGACGHQFHTSCMMKACQRKNSCPTCRQRLF